METTGQRQDRAEAMNQMYYHENNPKGFATIRVQAITGDGDYIPGKDDGELNEPRYDGRTFPDDGEMTLENYQVLADNNIF